MLQPRSTLVHFRNVSLGQNEQELLSWQPINEPIIWNATPIMSVWVCVCVCVCETVFFFSAKRIKQKQNKVEWCQQIRLCSPISSGSF